MGRAKGCVDCLRAALADRPDEPFAPGGPQPARYGARELSATGARALVEAGRARDPERRTWLSPEAAVRSYVRSRAEGASLRSTSDPDRAIHVQCSRDPSLGGREHCTWIARSGSDVDRSDAPSARLRT